MIILTFKNRGKQCTLATRDGVGSPLRIIIHTQKTVLFFFRHHLKSEEGCGFLGGSVAERSESRLTQKQGKEEKEEEEEEEEE